MLALNIMDNQYIKFFPKPFLDDLINGNVLPIIGAGFSRNGKSKDAKPSLNWEELGQAFASQIIDYHYNGAIDAISAFEFEYSRSKLIQNLYEFLKIGEIKPDCAHISFAKLPFSLVATTNFDYLLEEAYNSEGKFCRTIIEEEQLPIITNHPTYCNLFKIHGDLSHPSRLIATEEDYDSFLSNFPMIATFLTNLFISKTVLFIGYSVDDNDIRQIFQLIKNRLGKLKREAYTIRINASIQEINRFSRRGINVINIPIINKEDDYNTIFNKVFEELYEYWIIKLPTKATEENSEIDLILSKKNYELNNMQYNQASRLCFFSVSNNSLPYYKSHVFPIFYQYGLNPVSNDDFLDNQSNYLARINNLIETSTICIADLTSNSEHVVYEIKQIIHKLSTNKNFHAIFIKNRELKDFNKNHFYSLVSEKFQQIILTKFDKFEDRLHFVDYDPSNKIVDIDQLNIILDSISGKLFHKLEEQTSNLLQASQYNLAFLSAFIAFEKKLNDLRLKNRHVYMDKDSTFYRLINDMFKKNLINSDEFNELKRAFLIRNRIVHGIEDINLKNDEVMNFIKIFNSTIDKLDNQIEE